MKKTMMTMNMTAHAVNDRLDRLVACVETLGLGKILLETNDQYDNNKGVVQQITATGIILIVEKKTNTLITGYMAQPHQVYAMYHRAGYNKVPPKIYARVQKNCSRYSYLLTM